MLSSSHLYPLLIEQLMESVQEELLLACRVRLDGVYHGHHGHHVHHGDRGHQYELFQFGSGGNPFRLRSLPPYFDVAFEKLGNSNQEKVSRNLVKSMRP